MPRGKKKKTMAYRVANPRGIPSGIPILKLAPPCDECVGSGVANDGVCIPCEGTGHVVLKSWYEGDAISPAELEGFDDMVSRGFVVAGEPEPAASDVEEVDDGEG